MGVRCNLPEERVVSATVTAMLIAVDDQYAIYNQTSMSVYDPGLVVTSSILKPSGYGYIKLTGETAGNDSAVKKQMYADFRDALLNIRNNGSHGLIHDMRENYGGLDALSTALVGTFYNIIGPPDSLNLRFLFGCSTDRNLSIQRDSDSPMTGGVIPDIRVPINGTVIDQLYLDRPDVEVPYAIKMLNSILAIE